MKATFKLLNSYFWKTYYGPILSFVFPVILLAILGNIFSIQYVYPGILAMSILFIGVLALPLAIMELKESSLFKYIGSSPVNPLKFTIVAIGFYVFIALLSGFIVIIFTMIIFSNKVFPSGGITHGMLSGLLTVEGAFSYLVSVSIHLLFVIATGILISTISKSPQQALTIALVVIIPTMFLSGMVLSVEIIGSSPVMNWISRLIPFRYSTANMVVSATPIDQLGSIVSQFGPKDWGVMFGFNGQKDFFDHSSVGDYGSWFDKDAFNGNGAVKYGAKMAGTDWQKNVAVVDNINFWEFRNDVFLDMKNHTELTTKFFPGGDRTLFRLIFENPQTLGGADNNIFNFKSDWGVRRIPDVNSIRSFVQQFFAGESGHGGNSVRFMKIWNQISSTTIGASDRFRWLNMFMNQTNTLYFKADRVANLAVPVWLSFGFFIFITKRFSWSTR